MHPRVLLRKQVLQSQASLQLTADPAGVLEAKQTSRETDPSGWAAAITDPHPQRPHERNCLLL